MMFIIEVKVKGGVGPDCILMRQAGKQCFEFSLPTEVSAWIYAKGS